MVHYMAWLSRRWKTLLFRVFRWFAEDKPSQITLERTAIGPSRAPTEIRILSRPPHLKPYAFSTTGIDDRFDNHIVTTKKRKV